MDPSSDHADESVVDWQTQGLDGSPRSPCWELLVGRSRLARCLWGIARRAKRGTSDTAGGAQQIDVSNWAVRNALNCRQLRTGVNLVGHGMSIASALDPRRILEPLPSNRQCDRIRCLNQHTQGSGRDLNDTVLVTSWSERSVGEASACRRSMSPIQVSDSPETDRFAITVLTNSSTAGRNSTHSSSDAK